MPITLRNTVQKGLIGNEWGVPTIYIDPDTGEIMKSDEITAIGVVGEDDDPTILPAKTTVIQVGFNVTEVHYLLVQDNIIPEDIFKYATNVTDFSYVFRSTNIEKIPEGLFDNCTKVTNFAYAFGNCQRLQAIPAGLFDKNTLATDFTHTFFNCQNIETIPEGLFDNCSRAIFFRETFFNCISLKAVPKGLFDSCVNTKSFEGTFNECISLKSIPEDLFQNNQEVMSFEGTFYGCAQLEGTMPMVILDGKKYKLWELRKGRGYPYYINGYHCFRGCKKLIKILTGFMEIPKDWR